MADDNYYLGAPRPRRPRMSVDQRLDRIEKVVMQVAKGQSRRNQAQATVSGNRAIFTATSASVAAAATGAIAQVANAPILYRYFRFSASQPGRFTSVQAAGQSIFDGGNVILITDPQAPAKLFTVAEGVLLNGNTGFTASFTNDGAAAGFGTVEASPVPFDRL